MYGPVTHQNKEEKEVDLPDNFNVADWNKALSKALGREIIFSNWTLASLDAGMNVVNSSAEYSLSKPKSEE